MMNSASHDPDFRATWINTAMDAGFATAMPIRPKCFRDLFSVLFSLCPFPSKRDPKECDKAADHILSLVDYLIYSADAEEKVRKYRALSTVEFLRSECNYGPCLCGTFNRLFFCSFLSSSHLGKANQPGPQILYRHTETKDGRSKEALPAPTFWQPLHVCSAVKADAKESLTEKKHASDTTANQFALGCITLARPKSWPGVRSSS